MLCFMGSSFSNYAPLCTNKAQQQLIMLTKTLAPCSQAAAPDIQDNSQRLVLEEMLPLTKSNVSVNESH